MSSADEDVLCSTSRAGEGTKLHRTDDDGNALCDKAANVREASLTAFPKPWQNWCTICDFIDEHGRYPGPDDYPLDDYGGQP